MCAALLAMSVFLVGCGKKNNTSSSGAPGSSTPSSSITSPDDHGTSDDQNAGSSLGDTSGQEHPIASALEEMVEGVYNDFMNGADNWLDKMDEDTMKTAYDMDFSNFDEYYGRVPGKNVHATA